MYKIEGNLDSSDLEFKIKKIEDKFFLVYKDIKILLNKLVLKKLDINDTNYESMELDTVITYEISYSASFEKSTYGEDADGNRGITIDEISDVYDKEIDVLNLEVLDDNDNELYKEDISEQFNFNQDNSLISKLEDIIEKESEDISPLD